MASGGVQVRDGGVCPEQKAAGVRRSTGRLRDRHLALLASAFWWACRWSKMDVQVRSHEHSGAVRWADR